MEKVQLKDKLEIILIGGSAGSFHIIMNILRGLENNFSIPIIIVLHRKNDDKTGLIELMNSSCNLMVKEAEDKDIIRKGFIYIAPSDYHVLVEKNGSLSLDYSEKINFSRPSIDVTFQTAAEAFGSKVTAILLSGSNQDGTEGLKTVKEFGGTTVIQNPKEAEFPFMPDYALKHATIDKIIGNEQIVSFIKNCDSKHQL